MYQRERNAMGAEKLPIISQFAITILASMAYPQPTGRRFLYVRPKPLLKCCVPGHYATASF